MKEDIGKLLADVNTAIIKVRGAYALWCKEQGITYHELLICYSIRDFGVCTQKQICEQYLLPKQTIHNTIMDLQRRGLVELKTSETNWREKVITLTEQGKDYYESIMGPLGVFEEHAVLQMGEEQLHHMAELTLRYGNILEEGLVKSHER